MSADPADYAERVEAGAAWLDEHKPDWTEMAVPTYRLACRDERSAETLAELLRGRGYVKAEAAGSVMLLHYGGPLQHLMDIYDLCRDLDLAGDVEWSEFLMQAARLDA